MLVLLFLAQILEVLQTMSMKMSGCLVSKNTEKNQSSSPQRSLAGQPETTYQHGRSGAEGHHGAIDPCAGRGAPGGEETYNRRERRHGSDCARGESGEVGQRLDAVWEREN